MALLFRHADRQFGFTWNSSNQPAARWHADGEGPVQYLADTPDGAWAEFLRHEEITDPDELDGIDRRVWAIEVPDVQLAGLTTIDRTPESISDCQAIARQARADGVSGLRAPSAALTEATGRASDASGLTTAPSRATRVVAFFGEPEGWVGWMCHDTGTPHPSLLARVRHFARP